MESDSNAAITTAVDRDTASATAVVAADAAAVFDFLCRPANHALLSGDGSVRGTATGPERLGPGDRFGMKMKLGVPYKITSKVVSFEEGRRIAWAHFGGHVWRWELEPQPDGTTRVTETFDLRPARAPWVLRLAGYPKRHEANVRGSVAKVRARFEP